MSSGTSQPHDRAPLHVSGRAQYCDDIPLPANTLHAAFGLSRIAHGRITALDLAAVLESPGVAAIALPADIPGENNYGGAVHDDPSRGTEAVADAGKQHRAGELRHRQRDLHSRHGEEACAHRRAYGA